MVWSTDAVDTDGCWHKFVKQARDSLQAIKWNILFVHRECLGWTNSCVCLWPPLSKFSFGIWSRFPSELIISSLTQTPKSHEHPLWMNHLTLITCNTISARNRKFNRHHQPLTFRACLVPPPPGSFRVNAKERKLHWAPNHMRLDPPSGYLPPVEIWPKEWIDI